MYSTSLKFLKEEHNLTQEDIAKILNISRGSYCHYEIEDDILPVKHLNTLANYFNVSFDYLFSFTTLKNYPDYHKDIDAKIAGIRLKSFRKENKLTQKKLAELLKSDNSTISKYEKGINLIATPFLYTICKKYNISADYLLGKIDKY